MQKAIGKTKGPRMIHEIRRMAKLGISQRKIAKALDISRNTVNKYLSDTADKRTAVKKYTAPWADQIDWSEVNSETEKGGCLYHYWEVTIDVESSQLSVTYISFWREFKRRFPSIPIDLHKVHPPGERCEVDFKGETRGLGYINSMTKQYVPCRMFGAILCFSQLLFILVTEDEKQPSFLNSVARSYEYFGGVPESTAVDNANPQVTKAHRYDMDLNPEFFKFANHYGTAPLAMRPGKPKDKNLIENALGVFWRWARRKINKKTFRSLGEINSYILELLEAFNNRPQRKYGMSRREKFESAEKHKLLRLPEERYDSGIWKKAKVHPDSHIQVEFNFYSVPYRFVGQQVDVRVTSDSIEIHSQLERVAIYQKLKGTVKGKYRTNKTHLPQAHQAIKEQTPQWILEEAESIGPATLQVIERLLNNDTCHPFTYLRRAMGVIRLAKRHSQDGLETACETVLSLQIERPKLKDIEGIIKFNKVPKTKTSVVRLPNENLRGQDSWRNNIN